MSGLRMSLSDCIVTIWCGGGDGEESPNACVTSFDIKSSQQLSIYPSINPPTCTRRHTCRRWLPRHGNRWSIIYIYHLHLHRIREFTESVPGHSKRFAT